MVSYTPAAHCQATGVNRCGNSGEGNLDPVSAKLGLLRWRRRRAPGGPPSLARYSADLGSQRKHQECMVRTKIDTIMRSRTCRQITIGPAPSRLRLWSWLRSAWCRIRDSSLTSETEPKGLRRSNPLCQRRLYGGARPECSQYVNGIDGRPSQLWRDVVSYARQAQHSDL
jgi:hypothetical protein